MRVTNDKSGRASSLPITRDRSIKKGDLCTIPQLCNHPMSDDPLGLSHCRNKCSDRVCSAALAGYEKVMKLESPVCNARRSRGLLHDLYVILGRDLFGVGLVK